MGLWDTLRRWFGAPAETPSRAADVLRDMRSSAGEVDADFAAARNRLAVLVIGEADRQRLWRRAHRGEPTAARLLSGIRKPTPRERQLLDDLIAELERGR
jgi:hypothetical protein